MSENKKVDTAEHYAYAFAFILSDLSLLEEEVQTIKENLKAKYVEADFGEDELENKMKAVKRLQTVISKAKKAHKAKLENINEESKTTDTK